MGEMQNLGRNEILNIVLAVLDDDEDDEDPVWEKVNVNVHEFLLMGDPCFKKHFRFTKTVFQSLSDELANHLSGQGKLQRNRRPFEHTLLMVLWIMATPDSFRSVAVQFGVLPNTVHTYYVMIITALRELGPRFVSWPDAAERNAIKARCERRTGFPGIVGAKDGKHIFIMAPRDDAGAYRNRHHAHSILVQAVCDDRKVVRDLYVGEAGSLNDARVFRRSPLCRAILTRPHMFSPGEHIVADSAYKLLDRVLTPFENHGRLNVLQRNYNRRLSRNRVRIEHCFGLVSMVWRRIMHLKSWNMEYIVDHDAACFILHNFKLLHGDDFPEMPEEDGEDLDGVLVPEGHAASGNRQERMVVDLDDPYVIQGDAARLLQEAHERGEEKRWDIANN